jgi:hypothetical protein
MTDILRRSLRAAGVSFALLTAAAPMALADSPGYLFRDFDQQTATSAAPMQAGERAVRQNMTVATASTQATDRHPQTSSMTVRLLPSRSGMN